MGTHPIFESDFDCLTEDMSRAIGALAVGGVGAAVAISNSLYTVEGGHRAVKFNRFTGVGDTIYSEGLHFRIPWVEWPLIYDIRARPYQIKSDTGTKDLQMVDLGLRILYRPNSNQITWLAKNVGLNYDEKVLPSITHETLKSVIANFTASDLLTKRNEVSNFVRNDLEERSKDFKIILDDVAITDTQFSPLFTQSIEQKQIIVAAQGEATSARLIGEALKDNPAYLKLQRI